MKNNIVNIGKKCCGCRSCEQSCPFKAISFVEDEEGFMQPHIEDAKCVDCGKCLKSCPIAEPTRYNNQQYGYAAKLINRDVLAKSSSGGLFYALASNIIEVGGFVCGCAYDESLQPRHVIVDSLEGLFPLMGSKYVQSNMEGVYVSIRERLATNRSVLFVGTPCQVAGLRKFLVKDYENLYCVDIICHGVPSRKLFRAYLTWLGDKLNGEIIKFNFRDKERHKWSLTLSALLQKENGRMVRYDKMASLDTFYYNFLQGNNYRESCYSCPYSCSYRIGDITIGDFWGIEREYPELFDINGVSCALLNTDKGKCLWKHIEDRIESHQVEIDSIIRNNGNLNKPTTRREIRDSFYKEFSKNGFDGVPYTISRKEYIVDTIKNIIPNEFRQRIKRIIGK